LRYPSLLLHETFRACEGFTRLVSECKSESSEVRIAFRTLNGVLPFAHLTCGSDPPESVEEWNTFAIRIPFFTRLWGFEFRQSAEALAQESIPPPNIHFDVQPLDGEEIVDRLTSPKT